MPVIEVTVLVKQDGVDVPGFPYTRRVQTDGAKGLDTPQASTGTFVGIPSYDTLAIVALASLDEAVSVRLNAQSTASIDLNAGGLVLVVDGAMDTGDATSNVKVDNNSGEATQLLGLVAGT